MKEIIISGKIGTEVRPDAVRAELSSAKGQSVRLLINSVGGVLFAGKELIEIVRSYPGHVEAFITGLAASMASALAVSANSLTVNDQSVFMIHLASGGAMGNRNDMEKMTEILDALDQQLAELYAAKTRRSVAEMLDLMDQESWFYGEEILSAGFADSYEQTGSKHDRTSAILDARSRFAAAYHAPTIQEVAAYAGTLQTRVKSFAEWRSDFPHNSKVSDICDRAESAGRSPESCVIALTLAANPRALTKDEREMCKMMGLSESEFLRYSEGV